MMHFAGFSSKNFAAAVQTKRDERSGEYPIDVTSTEAATPVSPVAEAEEPVIGGEKHPASEPPKATYTLEALIERATKNYQSKLGQIIRVTEYANVSGYFQGTRDASNGQRYDLALVIETPEKELAIGDLDENSMPYVRGTWSLKFLTGPLAEQTGFVHSPLLHSDGSFCGDMMLTGKTIEDMGYESLSHQDLVTLAWRDAQAISQKQVYIKSCCGYFGDTDQQHYIQLDPPALVTGDPISIDQFRIDSDRAKYQIRDFDKGNDVIDWDFDFTSDDPRLEPYRSLWAGPASYYQSGKMDANEIVVGYDPEQDLDKEPTISTMR
ncbi:hypothetical protein FFR93_04695 [Rhizobium sp. MHM7A]|nr:hypothetical protein FFR93_04695 [Rhizobium sp. MHM7A]